MTRSRLPGIKLCQTFLFQIFVMLNSVDSLTSQFKVIAIELEVSSFIKDFIYKGLQFVRPSGNMKT